MEYPQCCVFVAEAREKALAEARVGYVKESLLSEVKEWATATEAAAKRSESEVTDLTQVLNDKNKELEDVTAEHKGKLATALQERDEPRTTTTAAQKQLAAWKKNHDVELATEKEASGGTILALQKEKTSFEAFVRELSRQLLGESLCAPLVFFMLLDELERAIHRAFRRGDTTDAI
jgi:phosphate starvation-inducible protein PhoH